MSLFLLVAGNWNVVNESFVSEVSRASRSLLKQLQDASEKESDSVTVQAMCERNKPKMTSLMSDNKRLVEILERKDAEIDYLLRMKKSSPPKSTSNNRDDHLEHDASERVCVLTDKLTKLLDENKQLKQCIRELDREDREPTFASG